MINRESRYKDNRMDRTQEDPLSGPYIGNWKIQLSSNKLSCCPRMRKLLDLPKGYPGKLTDLFELVKPEQLASLIEQFKAARGSGGKFEKQVLVTTPYGKEKWVLLTGVLYARRWGTPEQMIGTIEDVTQVINEDCLSMAIVNHELRAPLTIIKLNTQFLINHFEHSLNKQPSRLLNMVDEHVNGMTRLIDEYLSPSAGRDKTTQLNLCVFNIEGLVDTVLGEMRVIYPGHRFCKFPGSEVFQVRADKYKITQVLINYLTNAAKFSPPCAPISVSMERSGNEVTVGVHDQGVGINEESAELLFQKYYQCNLNQVRQKNSRGLGLYIVKNIIQNHCGTVNAENGQNGGAVFSFSLPLNRQSNLNSTGEEAVKMMA